MSFADLFFPLTDLTACWLVPALAVILDALIGDPPKWPHPVRLIGALCAFAEPLARRLPVPERLAGGVAVCFVLTATWVAARLLPAFPAVVACIFAVYLSFAGLALGQLLREGNAARVLLEQNDIEGARAAVGMLVSRDVSQSDRPELCRVLAETLAENLNDAFVAPFFWLTVGGPVGLWLYKAASTMDSLWGYPHEPWTRFGTAAARLDDGLAYVPARLTALFLFLTAPLAFSRTGGSTKPSYWPGFARVREDARKMKSPNAGWPMAACAWIHNAAMGGPAVYAGKTVAKPVLGPPGAAWTTDRLKALCGGIMAAGYASAAMMLATGCIIHALLR